MKLACRLICSLALAGAVHAVEIPRTFAMRGADLVAARVRFADGDRRLAAVVAQLRAEADALLKLPPASVMDKPRVAASGNRHDYFSQAPYWWPDPAKPNGLPYVRDDGRINPESKAGTDSVALRRTCEAVQTLGLAYWLTRDERYAQKAARLTRVWFLDPATRMNPHLEFAQAIPGINDGRGIGIIETSRLVAVTDGLALLAGSPAWTAKDTTEMTAWLGDYFHWLTTSKNGREEAHAEGVFAGNNHGSWYDAQAVNLALVLGRTDEARRRLAAVAKERIARQIEPDGRQPLELARTKSLNYSLFNLEALVQLSVLGEHVGVDLWKFSTSDGRSLRAAVRFLAPYADPAKAWLQPDLEAGDRRRILPLLVEALRHGEDADFRAQLQKFSGQPLSGEYWRLTWIDSP